MAISSNSMWIFVAFVGYLLAAIAVLLDKLLLRSRIPEPSVYAFFVALFSLFGVILVPFGFTFWGWLETLTSLLSGVLFVYGILAFYAAVKREEISKVAPLVGSIVPVAAFLFSLLLSPSRMVDMSFYNVIAALFLVLGGIFLSIDVKKRTIFTSVFKYEVLAGVLIALSFVLLKYAFLWQNFSSGFVWSRFGMFIGGVTLLLWPTFRGKICIYCDVNRKRRKIILQTGSLFILNKTLSGLSYLLINYSVFLGSVVLVQAMASIQYAAVFILAVIAARLWPGIFEERYEWRQWSIRVVSFVFIAIGLIFAAIGGNAILF